jgi:hypothetical protein
MIVYTQRYRPFVFGPPVDFIKCNVEVHLGSFDVGSGYRAYIVVAPNGKVFIAEAETGAFIGPSIEQVKEDIKIGDPEEMKKQIETARKQLKQAVRLEPEEFWKWLKCNKED